MGWLRFPKSQRAYTLGGLATFCLLLAASYRHHRTRPSRVNSTCPDPYNQPGCEWEQQLISMSLLGSLARTLQTSTAGAPQPRYGAKEATLSSSAVTTD